MSPRARTVAELTDPYIWTFVPPPPFGDGVCDVCHGAPRQGWKRCWSCSQAMRQVSRPVELVVPISLYRLGEQFHHVLWGYKSLGDERARLELRFRVAALLYRFLHEHGPCIAEVAGLGWNIITTVPSSGDRAGAHPLEEVITMAVPLREQHQRLVRRGSVATGHNRASDQGFEVVGDVSGAQVLLIDDTFTTGARLQSAASALGLAGAVVVAAVTLGRVIDPGFSAESQKLWEWAREQGFSFDRCCLE